METIKCAKCGTVMSAMSEACPVCGTPTTNAPAVDNTQVETAPVTSDDVKVLQGLKEVIEEALARSQKVSAGDYTTFAICTYDYNSFGGGHEDNWVLVCQEGNIYFDFNGLTPDEKERVANLGNDEITGGDFGTDVGKATKLFSTFIRKVWLFDGEEQFEITEV